MNKDKQITLISQFPTEVLVFYFKKFRSVKHYEYENDYCEWVSEDVTTQPFEHNDDGDGDNYWDNGCMHISFEGMHWSGKRDEFINELNSREHVDITAKNFKKWKIQYKKSLKKH